MSEAALLGLPVELVLAGAAGVLLNLTPCVLPAVPLKVRSVLAHAGAARRQRLISAIVFAGGTLAFFLVVGLATALLHWSWGRLFQSPPVLGALVVVLAVLAVLTYRDTRLPVPNFASRLSGTGYWEPFWSGALVGLLATPCTGPFLGGVLAFALTRPPATVVAIFLAVGAGLAAPYVVLLLRPQLLERLPRAGAWSVRLRETLAFLLLAGAVFFAQSLLPQPFGRWLWWAWLGLLLLWTGVAIMRSGGWPTRAVAVVAGAAGVVLVVAGGLAVAPAGGPLGWQPFSAARLAAARAGKRPALVEFTADWCINCKVLEKTVYADAGVVSTARQVHLVALRVDLTRPHPALERRLAAWGGVGLPFAIVFDTDGRPVKRLSGLFSAHMLTTGLRRAAAGAEKGAEDGSTDRAVRNRKAMGGLRHE